jgi:hypothetical protein
MDKFQGQAWSAWITSAPYADLACKQQINMETLQKNKLRTLGKSQVLDKCLKLSDYNRLYFW